MSINGNVCTLLGNKPEALFCRPPVAGVKPLCTHGVKSGNILVLWLLLQLILWKEFMIGKVFKPKSYYSRRKVIKIFENVCSM